MVFLCVEVLLGEEGYLFGMFIEDVKLYCGICMNGCLIIVLVWLELLLFVYG